MLDGWENINFRLDTLAITNSGFSTEVISTIVDLSATTLRRLLLDIPTIWVYDDNIPLPPYSITYPDLLPLLVPVYANLISLSLRQIHLDEAALILPFCTNLKSLAIQHPGDEDDDEFDLEDLKTLFHLLPNTSLISVKIDFCVSNTSIEGSVELAAKSFFEIEPFKNVRYWLLDNLEQGIEADCEDCYSSMENKGIEVWVTSGEPI